MAQQHQLLHTPAPCQALFNHFPFAAGFGGDCYSPFSLSHSFTHTNCSLSCRL